MSKLYRKPMILLSILYCILYRIVPLRRCDLKKDSSVILTPSHDVPYSSKLRTEVFIKLFYLLYFSKKIQERQVLHLYNYMHLGTLSSTEECLIGFFV